jgi:hypothetical protein
MKHTASSTTSGFLQKKNNNGSLHGKNVAPMQPTHAQPGGGVSNTSKQSYSNTKAALKGSAPQGKPHAKVMGGSPSQVGKYL